MTSLSLEQIRHIQLWTLRNRVVQKTYFLEQAIATPIKEYCRIDGCYTRTRSRTGLCPEHRP